MIAVAEDVVAAVVEEASEDGAFVVTVVVDVAAKGAVVVPVGSDVAVVAATDDTFSTNQIFKL